MNEAFVRMELLYGPAAMERLAASRVAIFGLGGVGGYVLEALLRSGIGALDLVDHDVINSSNLNRQILATRRSLGRDKVEVARERAADINPACAVRTYKCFYLPENETQFDFRDYDYVVDAIDTVSGKLALIRQAQAVGTPIISAMGAGNKLDPSLLRVADLYETENCPLARIMRKECRKRGITRLKVVYSPETPRRPEGETEETTAGKPTPGSTAFVPSVAGLLLAAEVVKDLSGVPGGD